MNPETEDRLEAIEETGAAHKKSTGHETAQAIKYGSFPAIVVFSCEECGQELGRLVDPQ